MKKRRRDKRMVENGCNAVILGQVTRPQLGKQTAHIQARLELPQLSKQAAYIQARLKPSWWSKQTTKLPRLHSNLLKCPSDTAQPPRFGSKKISTMFQSMSPYHPTLDQSNVLLTNQPSAEVVVVDCLWV